MKPGYLLIIVLLQAIIFNLSCAQRKPDEKFQTNSAYERIDTLALSLFTNSKYFAAYARATDGIWCDVFQISESGDSFTFEGLPRNKDIENLLVSNKVKIDSVNAGSFVKDISKIYPLINILESKLSYVNDTLVIAIKYVKTGVAIPLRTKAHGFPFECNIRIFCCPQSVDVKHF